jgi:D-alanyl-D-alanine carboxypeptidase (penicillin-binding protein 5/6)/beta-lactamase class A
MRTIIAAGLMLLSHGIGIAGSLEDTLASMAKAHDGKVAIAVKHLSTGEVCNVNANEPMPTASLIKLAVMIEAYWQAHEKRISLSDKVAIRKDDKVPGSGILTEHFSDGASFALRDAVRLMIAFSDNTATNLVLDKIGIKAVNERMTSLKLPNTRIHAKVFRGSTTSIDPEGTKSFGLGRTTAREMVTLLEMIHEGKCVSADACKEMLEHMHKCDDKDKFPRFLPAGVKVAHKTGSVSDARTDAGILYLKNGPVAICVLTAQNTDKTWKPDSAGNLLCAKTAKAVFDYYEKVR